MKTKYTYTYVNFFQYLSHNLFFKKASIRKINIDLIKSDSYNLKCSLILENLYSVLKYW